MLGEAYFIVLDQPGARVADVGMEVSWPAGRLGPGLGPGW
jgi:hypothetical protein